ncbi:helix-turn-helix domain-containing protein [Kitasatospora sp. NPDC006697]|uniref:helix-turn-helix domain-containing protein n=1 Tax=Kitasatospora sp. NPDC006697 TaxID=3364020 RepID=UPI0036A75FC3
MVESGQQPGIVEIAYDNPDQRQAGIEVLSFDALTGRLRRSVSQRPSRLDFHQLILIRGGTGTTMVDFVTHPCGPGTLLHLRPGQVQRLPSGPDGQPARLDAVLLLFTADFPPPLPAVRELLDGFGPVARQPAPEGFAALDRAVAEIAAEYRALRTAPADGLTGELLRQLLAALLLRLARLGGAPAPSGELYRAFRRALEQRHGSTRSVEEYAALIGCSPRTLTRACLAATGRTAKQLADARVALQAQRLLAHTDLPVAAVGRALGFAEATNFGKFFTRETGRTPGAFRREQHG